MQLQEQFRSLIKDGKIDEALALAKNAFSQSDVSEDILAAIAGNIYELKLTKGFEWIQLFIERYPESLHPIRVFFGEILACLNRYDQASNEARIYLRMVFDRGLFSSLNKIRIIQEGVGMAFLLLTAVYTEAGARNHSKRILEYGKKQDISAQWKIHIDNEIKRLDLELQQKEFSGIDNKWETFFADASGYEDILKLCEDKGFELLAKRVELIEGQFRFGAGNYATGESEILRLLYVDNKGVYALV